MGSLQHSEEVRSTSATKEAVEVVKEATEAKRSFLQKIGDFFGSFFN